MIPAIDFSPFIQEEIESPLTPEQQHVCDAINSACRNHGFVRLVGTGIDVGDTFTAAKELFALPEVTKKNEIARIDPMSNMGYSPYASESLNAARPPELKEAMNVRFPPAHQNKWAGCPDSFREAVETLLPQLKVLSRTYLKACALALKLPVDFFADKLQKMDLCTVRFLHAPPCDYNGDAKGDDSIPLRVGEHTDFGAVTFLFYDTTSAGLQIKDPTSSTWQSIDAPSILVNTGGLMARWTNDQWKATAHRVVVESAEAARRHRYAIAFFVDPDADVTVRVHESFCRETPCQYEPMNSLDYLMMKLKEAQLRS